MPLSEAKPPLFARPDPASLRRNARNKQGSARFPCRNYLRGHAAWHRAKTSSGYEEAHAYRCARLFPLAVLAASPAVAQRATSNGQSQSTTQGTLQGVPSAPTPVPSQGPTTGVFCIEEMTATFCNVVTGPNTNGYGTRSAGSSSGSSSASGSSGGGGGTSSIPPCPAEPPFNELCN